MDLFWFDRYMCSIYVVRGRCNSLHDGCGWYQCTLNPVGASVHKSTHSHLGVGIRKKIAHLQYTATSTWVFPNSPSPKKGAVTAITPNCIMHSTRGEADAEKKLRWILVSLSAKWTWAKLFIPLCSHYPIISNRLFRIGRPPVSLLSDIYICGGPVDDCCSVPRAVSLRQLRTKWAPPSVRRAQRHSRPTWNADKQTTHLPFINKTKQQQNNHQASR